MSDPNDTALAPLPEPSRRDPRLRYGEVAASMKSTQVFSELPEDYRFHIIMVGELAAAELCAANIYECEDMPWDFYVDMARQCWDEARHVEINERWFAQGGKTLDQYEAVNIYYDLYHALSLEGRLVALGLVDELRALDGQRARIDEFMQAGQVQKARSTERIMHEEVRHVAVGYRWLEHLAQAAGTTREALTAAGQQELLELMTQRFGPLKRPAPKGPPPSPPPLDVELRRRAGFTEEEIRAMAAKAQGRPLRDEPPYIAAPEEP